MRIVLNCMEKIHSVSNTAGSNKGPVSQMNQEKGGQRIPPPQICHCVVMLLQNLNTKGGLCNWTCLMIKRLHRKVIDAEVLLGTQQAKRVLMPKVVLASSYVDHSFVLCHHQFPVRLYNMGHNHQQGPEINI